AQRADGRQEVRRRLVGRGSGAGRSVLARGRRVDVSRECFELGANRFARGRALAARDLVPLGESHEEAIAGPAEALPDRLRSALLDRTDRLPLGLEALDLGGRLVPIARVGERFGLDAQRFLLREVLLPHILALGE